MNTFIKLVAVLMTFSLMSFSGSETPFIGTYGVSGSNHIKLIINADHTFYYQDFSNPNEQIAVHGNWTTNGKKVELVSNDSTQKFHDTWTFENDEQVAKSHKGMAFYRLCKISDAAKK